MHTPAPIGGSASASTWSRYQRLRRLEIGTRGDTELEQKAHEALNQIETPKAA